MVSYQSVSNSSHHATAAVQDIVSSTETTVSTSTVTVTETNNSLASCSGNCTTDQTTLPPTKMSILNLRLTNKSLLVTLQNTGNSDLLLYNIVVDQNTTSDPILRSVAFFDVLNDSTLIVPQGNFTGGPISLVFDLKPDQVATFSYLGAMTWQHSQGSIVAGNIYWIDISGHFADVYVKTVATVPSTAVVVTGNINSSNPCSAWMAYNNNSGQAENTSFSLLFLTRRIIQPLSPWRETGRVINTEAEDVE